MEFSILINHELVIDPSYIRFIVNRVATLPPVVQHQARSPDNATEPNRAVGKYISSDITSDMLSDWISRVGSSIPRGFSRHYVLSLLKDAPMTGKEIIDRAVLQSDGKWRPSPGLIYPMLGRLLEEGLIEEAENGRYRITLKGLEMASDVQSINNIIQKQLDVMLRFGNVGKFMALDLIDRASAIGTALSSNLDKMTEQEKGKYREFLVSELKKLDDQELKEKDID
ncbi:MAG TPA: PadR family transcriptional regulator [Nitrososphaeraceae archaeon]|nr:PadR family transcriptional regulator [Nitrososphaeraceae archaeon]